MRYSFLIVALIFFASCVTQHRKVMILNHQSGYVIHPLTDSSEYIDELLTNIWKGWKVDSVKGGDAWQHRKTFFKTTNQ